MYNEMNPEIFGDQGIYYTTPTNYAYYCTGFETPVEWEDHNRTFALDGSEIQFAGAQNENSPYAYYTPAYGYAQSPYNPYNPYIPSAVLGVDGSYVAPQQYYTVSPYQDAASSAGYVPVIFQPDTTVDGLAEPLLDHGVEFASRYDGRSSKHGVATSSASYMRNSSKYNSTKISEGARANVGSSKQPAANASFSSGAPASSHAFQRRNASASSQSPDNFSNGKFLPHHNQLKVALPANNGFSDFGSTVYGHTTVDKLQSKFHSGRKPNDVHGSSDVFDEQNRGPRTNKLKNQLAVKAYTTKVGNCDAQGNIIIYTDQYNRDDFPVEYDNAKFFVIKSYSEDDVHKSIKYGVWSSTSHGNKKLQLAYEDAQKSNAGKAGGCPIFLFFSVNASGQFCGVAEMIGSVDFHKDMDFWQQDKWSGSFPVKWHYIKDVPNTSFRHIILENNENKPVTNSRDTQEIMFKQGLEMLRIIKSHNLKTSLLDDFMYYENRQKIMHDEKARYQSYETPFLIPAHKLNRVIEQVPIRGEVAMEQNDPSCLKKSEKSSSEQISNKNTKDNHSADTIAKVEANSVATLNLGSLSLNTKQAESPSLPNVVSSSVSTESTGVVTVGSVPVKVKGLGESSSDFLTVGTIPLDPKALQIEKGGRVAKRG